MEKVEYAVKASSNDTLNLWEKWHKRVSWEQVSAGKVVTVGHINNRPICVELFWNILNGHKVLFYYGCSELVDHRMIGEWVKKNALEVGADMVNAANFHNIARYLLASPNPPSKA